MYLKKHQPSFPTGYNIPHAQYYLFLRNGGSDESVHIEIHVNAPRVHRVIFKLGSVDASIWNHCGIRMLPQEIKEWFIKHLRIQLKESGEDITLKAEIPPFFEAVATERVPYPTLKRNKTQFQNGSLEHHNAHR
jgi:hypothetical protein